MVEILEANGGRHAVGTVLDLSHRQPDGVRFSPPSFFDGLTAEQLKLLG